MFAFELADLIRLNQLVRERIDIDGFRAWYDSLPAEGRRALTHVLCEFAHQAGVSESTWTEALSASGFSESNPLVAEVLSVGRAKHGGFMLGQFLRDISDEDLPTAFELFVYLFGVAEGTVYRGESKRWCNHWWHRDLLDERVVEDLLNDPEYFFTSMADDDRIKG